MSDEVVLIPKDITDEVYREYDLGDRVHKIDNPQLLYVGNTTHRIIDGDGIVHCVPFPIAKDKIVVLRWKPRDKSNPVKF